MDTATFYELLGGVAFLLMAGAHVLAVVMLRSADPEPDTRRTPAKAGAASGPLPLHALERRMDESRTLRARHLRDLLRPAG